MKQYLPLIVFLVILAGFAYTTTIFFQGEIACSLDSDCDDSEVFTEDSCVSPATEDSYCLNTWCSPECVTNLDCDDSITTTLDECVGKGSCNAVCANTSCTIACVSNTDCTDSNSLTVDSCLNPGKCSSECKNTDCSYQCTANSQCDDSDAATTDLCVVAGECDAVCVNLPNYGNSVCDAEETKCSAPSDCGTCSGAVTGKVCRQYDCFSTACREIITPACCGNGVCETGEDFISCAFDCDPELIDVNILNPAAGTFFLRGETAPLKISVSVDAHKVKNAVVYAKGFFGRMRLQNDGQHDDGTPYDNIYANSFTVPANMVKGNYSVFIEIEYSETSRTLKHFLEIDPKLSMTLDFDKQAYLLGDIIKIDGTLRKHSTGISKDVNLVISDSEGNEVYSTTLISTLGGGFSTEYHTTFLDIPGEWKLTTAAEDESFNTGSFDANITVADPFTQTLFLDINLVGNLAESYVRGNTISLVFEVRDFTGQLADDANISILDPQGKQFTPEYLGQGRYGLSYILGWDIPLAKQKFSVSGKKTDDLNITYAGSAEVDINVTRTTFSSKILEPTRVHFSAGDEVEFILKISYDDKQPVVNAISNAFVNDEPIELIPRETGIYYGTYVVQVDDYGEMLFSAEIKDPYGNTSSVQHTIEVSGISLWYYVREYGLIIFSVALALIAFSVFLVLTKKRKKRFSNLLRREQELKALMRDSQKQYFTNGAMSRQYYEQLMAKYELEIESVNKKIERVKEMHKKEEKK